MPHPADDATLRKILTEVRHIGLLGASDKTNRPSHEVMHYLLDRGYEVYPVNPRLAGQEILGRTVYANVDELPESVEMLELFLNSQVVANMQDALLAHPAKVIWMQIGVSCPELMTRAEALGKTVVMDRCPKQELPRLGF